MECTKSNKKSWAKNNFLAEISIIVYFESGILNVNVIFESKDI